MNKIAEVATSATDSKSRSRRQSPHEAASLLDEITVLILTYNEAPNIGRTLENLRWARRILVVDSFSSDETLVIAGEFANVEVVQRRFDSFASQCNFGLQLVQSEWVLSLDADYVLSPQLILEISRLQTTGDIHGYSVPFRYCISGKPLRASLYPPRTVLYRKNGARYRDDGHGHCVMISGQTQALLGSINHDDRKSLDRWLTEQARYATAETRKLLETAPAELNAADRLRRWIVPAPCLVFFYTLLIKGLVFEGWRGWYYVLQRTVAEILLSLRLIEAKLNLTGNPT